MGKTKRKARRAVEEARGQAELAERRRSAELLLAQIERAFDGVPAPDAEHRTLRQAEAWDGYELIDQRGDHKGRWQDLPDAEIAACPNALPHLDAQGVRYYASALMTYLLRNPGRRADDLGDPLRSMLRPGRGELGAAMRQRFVLFTPEQRDTAEAFLAWLDDQQ
jgi:hypothetical protein